jgi:hypothetical protein
MRLADDADRVTGRITFEPSQLTGLTPAVALRTARIIWSFLDVGTKVWRVGHGGPEIQQIERTVRAPGLERRYPPGLFEYLEALAAVARHAMVRVVVPDFDTEPRDDIETVLGAAHLLGGGTLESPGDVRVPYEQWLLQGEGSARVGRWLSCRIGGVDVGLNVRIIGETALARAQGEPDDVGTIALVPVHGHFEVRLHTEDDLHESS